MPKETIRAEGFDVEVLWGRDQAHVQVSTVIRPPETATRIEQTPDGPVEVENPASLGALVDQWEQQTRYTARGLCATIDQRAAINDLIRVLKRARDQAFGRDE